jgi:thioester reductase-like protein
MVVMVVMMAVTVLPVTTMLVVMTAVIAVASVIVAICHRVAAEGQRQCSQCSAKRFHDHSRVGNTLQG